MDGETTIDIRITCVEERKISRTILCIGAWSEEIDTVDLVIENQDLENDKTQSTKIVVPLDQLIQALEAVRKVMLA